MAASDRRGLWHAIWQDMRFAGRSLRRTPGFVVTAVLSLGLAIGAGISGFGVIDAIRFRALPFPNADRLVWIGEAPPQGCGSYCSVHHLSLPILQSHPFRSLDAMAPVASGLRKSMGTGEEQKPVPTGLASAAFFSMLGANPQLGRTFVPEEDRLGGIPAVVISHELWTNQFGADRNILGREIVLSDERFTIVGVMPRGFRFEMDDLAWLAPYRYMDPTTGTSMRSIQLLGRLAPGVTADQLLAELRTLEAAVNEGRSDRQPVTFEVIPLRSRYVEATLSHDLMFAAIVGSILVIAAANVAGLLLIRSMRQAREFAVRTALGASRLRLTGFVFIENLLLATGGMVIGLVLAALTLSILRTAAPLQISVRPEGLDYRLEGHAVAFAIVLTVLSAALLSVAPARLLGKTQPQHTLRETAVAVTTSRRGHRSQQLFVIVQTACAVALLIGTGLLLKTLVRVSQVPLGYDAERIAEVSLFLPHSGRVPGVYVPLVDQLMPEFAAIPGVEHVAVRSSGAFGAARPGELATVLVDGRLLSPAVAPRSASAVHPDFFKVMGITLARGREFTSADVAGGAPVAIINEWAARTWWPGQEALGRTITADTVAGQAVTLTVVGVVPNNLAQGSVLSQREGPEVYRPFAQAHAWHITTYLRTRGRPPTETIAAAQRAIMRRVPNGRPAATVMADRVAGQIRGIRTNMLQIGGFALIGLFVAVMGIYGVLSYVVQQRTSEIGIRSALGADRRQILFMVLRQAVRLCLVGLAVGLGLALVGMRLMRGMLYGTPPNDVLVYLGVVALFLTVALGAGYLPARRATRIDPLIAIRSS